MIDYAQKRVIALNIKVVNNVHTERIPIGPIQNAFPCTGDILTAIKYPAKEQNNAGAQQALGIIKNFR